MSKDKAVYFYYALKIKIRVEFTRILPFLNALQIYTRTFVECSRPRMSIKGYNAMQSNTK